MQLKRERVNWKTDPKKLYKMQYRETKIWKTYKELKKTGGYKQRINHMFDNIFQKKWQRKQGRGNVSRDSTENFSGRLKIPERFSKPNKPKGG